VKRAHFGVLFALLMMVDENPSVRPPLTLPALTDKGIVALAEIYPIVYNTIKKICNVFFKIKKGLI
jgi:hypothetical protein